MFRIIICHLFWEIWAKVRNFLTKQPIIWFIFLQQYVLFFTIFHLLISFQFFYSFSFWVLNFLTHILNPNKIQILSKEQVSSVVRFPLKKGRSKKISISILEIISINCVKFAEANASRKIHKSIASCAVETYVKGGYFTP